MYASSLNRTDRDISYMTFFLLVLRPQNASKFKSLSNSVMQVVSRNRIKQSRGGFKNCVAKREDFCGALDGYLRFTVFLEETSRDIDVKMENPHISVFLSWLK